jgi:hypothetical protein
MSRSPTTKRAMLWSIVEAFCATVDPVGCTEACTAVTAALSTPEPILVPQLTADRSPGQHVLGTEVDDRPDICTDGGTPDVYRASDVLHSDSR